MPTIDHSYDLLIGDKNRACIMEFSPDMPHSCVRIVHRDGRVFEGSWDEFFERVFPKV